MSAPFKPASLMIIFVCILCVTIGGGYLGYRLINEKKVAAPVPKENPRPQLKRMANLPEKEELVPPPAPPEYRSDAPILEQVRQALRDGISSR